MRLSSLALALVAFAIIPAYAQDSPAKKSDDPAIQAIRDKAAEMAKTLTREESDALAQINAGFGIVRAVGIARADVSRAVDECSKKNPDMSKALKKEFSNWSGKVDPILKDHQKKMKKAIHGGVFKNPDDVDAYLALIDKAAKKADDKMEKRVVTTPEACKGTQEALSSTGDSLAELLGKITWPAVAEKKAEEKPAEKTEAPAVKNENEEQEKAFLKDKSDAAAADKKPE